MFHSDAVHCASSDVWDSNIVGTALDNNSKDDIGPQELTPVELLMSVGQGKSTPLVIDNGDNSPGEAWEPIDPSQLPIDDQLSIRCWELDPIAQDTESQACDIQYKAD